MKKIEEEIRNLERQLEEKKKIQANMKADYQSSRPMNKLAIHLHDKFCYQNHTDGCDWHYGIRMGVHDWDTNYAHAEWLKKAKELIIFCEDENIR